MTKDFRTQCDHIHRMKNSTGGGGEVTIIIMRHDGDQHLRRAVFHVVIAERKLQSMHYSIAYGNQWHNQETSIEECVELNG